MTQILYVIYITLLLFFADNLSIHFNIALFLTNLFWAGHTTPKRIFFYLSIITVISLLKPGTAGIDGIIVSLSLLLLYATYKLIPSYKRGPLFWLITFFVGTSLNYFIYFFLVNVSLHGQIHEILPTILKTLSYVIASFFLYLLQFMYAKLRDYKY